MGKPLIGIPIGDPAGIGPEIVAKALADPAVTAAAIRDMTIMSFARIDMTPSQLNSSSGTAPQPSNRIPLLPPLQIRQLHWKIHRQ